MSERPSGTVTFLTTDIEGSTRLWQTHHEAMKTALADHDRLVRTAIETHGGYVFSTAGDSFWAAFTHPVDAALAALDTHQAIAGHDWGDIGVLKVRAALDTGLADERAGDYFGPPLNRASRIMKHAHGGDTLCSHTTADLLKHDLPLGYQVAKVGRRRLRDVEETETLYRISTTSDTTRHTRWIPATAVVAVVAAVGVGGWATNGQGGDESTDNTTTTAAPITTESKVAWTVELGPLTTPPLIVGNYVIASPDNDTHQIIALHLDTGHQAWTTDMDSKVYQLATDNEYVYVTTRSRFEVLQPSAGDFMPTCGFELPGALAETAVGDHAVYIREYGAMYLVETHPGNQPCHSGLIENASYLSGLAATLPFASSGHVAVGDQRGVYVFDASTLTGVWKYPEYQETLSASRVAVRERTVEYAMRVESTVELMAITSDGDLYLFDLSQPPGKATPRMARLDPSFSPAFIGDGLVAVTRSGGVVAYDSNLEPLWSAFLPEEPITALGTAPAEAGTLLVATGSTVTLLDSTDGSQVEQIQVPHSVTSLAKSGQALLFADDSTGWISALRSASATEVPDWSPPLRPAPADDVATVVAKLVEAINAGDLRTVQALIAYDAFVWRAKYDGLWEREQRERVWARFEYGFVLGESWTLSDCSVDAGDPTSMTCRRVATDIVSEAASIPPDYSTTTFVVGNGVLRRIADAFEVWAGTHHDGLHAWIDQEYPEEYRAACVGPRPQSESGQCARLLVAHLDEWAATLEP